MLFAADLAKLKRASGETRKRFGDRSILAKESWRRKKKKKERKNREWKISTSFGLTFKKKNY